MTNIDKYLIKKLQSLPIDFGDFKNFNTKEYTHGIHSYPAMMVSPISRNIISIMKEYIPINSIFDPFSGSGTTLVEAMLAGINNIHGNDINPLALFLIKAKTTPLNIETLTKEANNLYFRINKQIEKYEKEINNVEIWICKEKN